MPTHETSRTFPGFDAFITDLIEPPPGPLAGVEEMPSVVAALADADLLLPRGLDILDVVDIFPDEEDDDDEDDDIDDDLLDEDFDDDDDDDEEEDDDDGDFGDGDDDFDSDDDDAGDGDEDIGDDDDLDADFLV